MITNIRSAVHFHNRKKRGTLNANKHYIHMIANILSTIDRSFDAGTYENFRLNEFLLVINTFLLFITALVLMDEAHWITIHEELRHTIHSMEIGFGIFFLIEFALRLYYTYIPDGTLFRLYPLIQILVIVSLLAPTLLNVAFLRILISLKMLKVYHMRRESQIQLAQNPDFAHHETLLDKATHPLERTVERVATTTGNITKKITRKKNTNA